MTKPDVVVGAPLADFFKRDSGEFVGERGGSMAEVVAQPTQIELNPNKAPLGFMPPHEHARLMPLIEQKRLTQHAIVIVDLTHFVGFLPPQERTE